MNTKQKTQQLVHQAEKILKEKPYDAIHDLTHHRQVWQLVQKIVKAEKLDVNLDALKIACFWHDVVTTKLTKENLLQRNMHAKETCNYLVNLMQQMGFSSTFISQVVTAIEHHDFANRQPNPESQVLYDADKLSALNLPRWKKLNQIIQAKTPKSEKYLKAARNWVKHMRSKYHFNFSRELHDQHIRALIANPRAQALAHQWHITISDALKS